jgi:hypothetical protein
VERRHPYLKVKKDRGHWAAAAVLLLPLLLSSARPVGAATILLQTNNAADSATTEDAPLVSFLSSLGHTVTTRGASGGAVPTAAELANVDLIIVSRNTTSGDYDDVSGGTTEPIQWNGLDKPLLLLAPHLARSSHWGFVNGLVGSPTNENVPLTALNPYPNPNHPFVAGAGTTVYLDGSRIDYVGSAEVPVGASLVATATAPLATGGTGDVAAIVDIPEGTAMAGPNGFAGDRRVFFLMNDYPDVTGVQFGLAPAGQQILGQIITELTVPEPGGAAVLAGVWSFSLLRHRRRRG